ncbi:permease-like cell division protein FtsX [uncultured Eubacterium sp.]|uniref:permease-like cell division protein FtsX n=1 Tax=uncultured Eubacterium sp. TaxID=165185 RepID=UPI002672F6EB|nr:permease-like cell division protein FtsX [uncultured Eubacterium sp.]
MNTRTARYCLNQGLVNIKRNKLFSLASIGTIAACIFLIGIIFTIIINVNFMEKQVEQNLGVTVFFDKGIQQQQVDAIGEQIKSDNRVEKYEYTSAEKAWEGFKDSYFEDDPDLASGFDKDNPLANSASYTVFLKNIDDQDAFVKKMESLEGVRKVKHSEQAKETLTTVGKVLGYVSVALIIILLGVGIFLISNTVMIGISVRQHEIKIMKLIGSTNAFVRAPFIIEGIIIGLIGSALPLILIRVIYNRLIGFVISKFGVMASAISFASARDIFVILVPMGLGIGAGIGLIGSVLSLRKHLKV